MLCLLQTAVPFCGYTIFYFYFLWGGGKQTFKLIGGFVPQTGLCCSGGVLRLEEFNIWGEIKKKKKILRHHTVVSPQFVWGYLYLSIEGARPTPHIPEHQSHSRVFFPRLNSALCLGGTSGASRKFGGHLISYNASALKGGYRERESEKGLRPELGQPGGLSHAGAVLAFLARHAACRQ